MTLTSANAQAGSHCVPGTVSPWARGLDPHADVEGTKRSASAPLNVLVTASTFPSRPDDGSPRFILDLAESLATYWNVTVLAPHLPGAARQERVNSIDIRRYSYFLPRSLQRLTPSRGRGMRENVRESRLARLQSLPFILCQALAVRRLVRCKAVDVINAHWLIPQGLAAAMAISNNNGPRRSRPRLVLHIHAGDVYLLSRIPLGARIARYIVRRADAVFADGSHVRETLNQLLGFDSEAVLQPMGVHTERFQDRPASAEANPGEVSYPAGFLLTVGRLVEKKGTIYLIRAMTRVRSEHPGIGLVVIGDGPERPRLEEEARRLDIAHAVRFLGARPHADVVESLQKCRAAVVPSIMDSRGETEGMPTTVTEALAAGAPVVASAVAGIPDVIEHGTNGWLCAEQDPESLADAILACLSVDRASMTIRARESARQYDWNKVASNYLECIQRLTSSCQRADSCS